MIIRYVTTKGQNCLVRTTLERGADLLAILIINKMIIREVKI